MKPWFRWLGVLAVTVVALLAVALAVLYALSGRRIHAAWAVEPPRIDIPSDSASIARGGHIARTRGCTNCHGETLGGKLFIDGFAIGRFSGSNLTPAGIGREYTDEDWVRAIRYGVGPAGRSLLFMPSHEFSRLGREDLGDLVAFLKTIAPIAREVPPPRVGPTARFLFLRGELPLVAAERIDHDAPLRHGPKPEVTAEYGEYLATGCAGCHGPNLSGGPVPGAPGRWPAASNLTPDPTGLGGWTEEQFTTVLRTGRRPDDRPLNAAYMPWTMTSRMTADELAALWLYFQSLEPVAKGVR